MAQLIPIDTLSIDEDRIRKLVIEHDVHELAESIATLGLMHAPVVQRDGTSLVAGYRRQKAIRELYEKGRTFVYNGEPVPLGMIPVVPLSGSLSAIDVREAELHENIKRVDLTWQEKADAIRELHELRAEQAKQDGREQTNRDTALEWYGDDFKENRVSDTKNDLLVAAFLDDPEVAKAPSRKEAIKRVEKKLRAAHRERLAKEFDVKKLETKHTLLQGDLLAILPTLDMTTIDCIVCDPPYGVGADKFANMSAGKHTYSDSIEYSNALIETIAAECYRIGKSKAHIYMFCDVLRFAKMKQIFSEAGWEVFHTPLIWYRGATVGVTPWPEHGPRRTYEAILYAMKGKRPVISILPDVIDVPHERGVERAATKPAAVYEALIRRSCYAGDTVLDPCCGTGPIFPAANITRTIAIGIEIDPEAVGIASERMEAKEPSANLMEAVL